MKTTYTSKGPPDHVIIGNKSGSKTIHFDTKECLRPASNRIFARTNRFNHTLFTIKIPIAFPGFNTWTLPIKLRLN